MDNRQAIEVSTFLTSKGISNEISSDGKHILVDRDDMCANFSDGYENDSYTETKQMLNNHFGTLFNFVAKTDDYLMLDRLF